MEQATSRQAVVATVSAIRAQIAKFHHLSLSDQSILTICLLNRVDVGGELLELQFPTDLAKRLRANRSKLDCAPEEVVSILCFCAAYSCDAAKTLLAAPAVAACVARLEGALRCTLLEKHPAQRWASPLVKVAMTLAFHEPVTSPLPVLALEALVGGIVKSDLRRLEDVHDALSGAPLDPLTMTALVECVASVCVG